MKKQYSSHIFIEYASIIDNNALGKHTSSITNIKLYSL